MAGCATFIFLISIVVWGDSFLRVTLIPAIFQTEIGKGDGFVDESFLLRSFGARGDDEGQIVAGGQTVSDE